MYVSATLDDGTPIAAVVVRIWPDDERVDVRHHGTIHTLNIVDIFAVADRLVDLMAKTQEQAIAEIRAALLEHRRLAVHAPPSAPTRNRYAALAHLVVPKTPAPTPALGTSPEPAPAKPPSRRRPPNTAPAVSPPASQEPPLTPHKVAAAAGPVPPPEEREVQRLSNGKLEMYFPLGATPKSAVIRNGKVDTITTSLACGVVYVTATLAASGKKS